MKIFEKCPVCGCLPGNLHENKDCVNLKVFCQCGDLECDGSADQCDICGGIFGCCPPGNTLTYDVKMDLTICENCKKLPWFK